MGVIWPNLTCMRCKGKYPRAIILEGMEGYCDECESHSKFCDCGCGEIIFRYKGRGAIREYVHGTHAGKTRKGISNKLSPCKACKRKVSSEVTKSNGGFCAGCIEHTKLCDCGCKEEIFRYNTQGGIRQCKNQSHRNRLVWTIPGARKNGSKAQLKRYEDPKERERQSRNMKNSWKNPRYKELRSRQNKEMWEDPEFRAYMSSKLPRGKNHRLWRGGTGYEPYSKEFTKDLKWRIRFRQQFMCADKDDTCSVDKKALHVHHIDRDKKNSSSGNLIALCASHHMRSHNKEARIRHVEYFSNTSSNSANRPI